MIRFRELMKKLLFPKLWIILLSVPVSAAGLVFVFGETGQAPWLAYCIYVCSFCSLTWVCARVIRSAGHWQQDMNTLIDRIPTVRKYFSDVSFKMNVSLYRSLGLNVLYAIAKFCFSVCYHSVWFATLAVYYLLLAFIRFGLLRYANRNAFGADQRAEWLQYRLCGILLAVMNIALSGMVFLAVRRNVGFFYPGYLIYMMAMYAFYSITAAVRAVIRYRSYHSPAMSAAKVLQLAAALVSMLALETAMLAQFGGNDTTRFREIMTGCTGGGVCVIILAIAVYMILRSSKMIRKLKTEETI